ncbi:hypothetical protein DFJ75_3459 [Williamsia muralis]|uniref:Uncharacterized protein n=1 Tax=Williamsia marianensis TaxID=85044 RepID=A0A495K5N7_WILMA|nr:hypothetical protein [Williamsia muralis]RKR96606.1 hypothetical protein DFJ75_3459 [Williamsia muralis]
MAAPFDPFGSGGRPGPSSGPEASRQAPQTPFGQGSSRPGTIEIAGPPAGLLLAAGAVALVGLVVGIIGRSGWLSIVGWTLSGPIAIGILAAFTLTDTKRRSAPVYTSPGWTKLAYGVVIAISIIGIVVGALGFAFLVGRL